MFRVADSCSNASKPDFQDRFLTREQVERYRDRYTTGRRGPVHRREQKALAQLLASIHRVDTALDIPRGTGRLSPLAAVLSLFEKNEV